MESINAFTKMNMDLDKSILPSDSYYKAVNFRPLTIEGITTEAIVNIKGNEFTFSVPNINNVFSILTTSIITNWGSFGINITTPTGLLVLVVPAGSSGSAALNDAIKTLLEANGMLVYIKSDTEIIVTTSYLSFNILNITVNTNYHLVTLIVPAQKNLQIIGWETIKDNILLITTPCTDTNPGGVNSTLPTTPSSTGQIWKVVYNEVTLQPTITLLYNNYLNLTTQHPIANPGQIEGRFETNDLQKIYWTDNFNKPRVFNIADVNGFALDPKLINLQASYHFSVPELTLISDDGILASGVYQLGYRLKNTGGAETTFSKLSNLIHIVTYSEVTTGYKVYEGNALPAATSKSIHAIINNLDTSYERIEIISVYYSQRNQPSPVIKIIFDEPVPTTGIYNIFYTGRESPLPVTLSQLLVNNIQFKTVGSIATKNNFLFFGNIKQENFDLDYDARAFRWQWGNTDIIGQGQMNWARTLPDVGNDINPNQSTNIINTVNPYLYKYNTGGAWVFGGTGVNISYTFDTEDINLDSTGTATGAPYKFPPRTTKNITLGTTTYQHVNFYEDFKSPYLDNLIRGYQRDEIYRFGIVFFNKAGQSSFVKWIADIQMPSIFMPDKTTGSTTNKQLEYPLLSSNFATPGTGANVFGKNLCIKFDVNIPQNIQDQVSGFSIVRMPRTQSDKTILGQGVLYPSFFNSFANQLYLIDDSYTVSDPTINIDGTSTSFNSPDFLFGGVPSFASGSDSIDIVALLGQTFQEPAHTTGGVSMPDYNMYKMYAFLNNIPFTQGNLRSFQLLNSSLINSWNSDSTTHVLNGLNVNNESNPQGGNSLSMGGRTSLLYGLFGSSFVNNLKNFDWAGNTNNYLANYKRTALSQYGGNTLSQKSTNSYVSTGHYQEVASAQTFTNQRVFGGDTYVTIFDNAKSFKHWPGPGALEGYGMYHPVETTVNTDLRIGGTLNINKDDFPNTGSGIDIDESFNMAGVYLTEDQLQKYYPKPIPYTLQDNFDNRIYHSEPKINGEATDAWADVKANNYIDVQGSYGPINQLIVNRDKVYYFQDTGIGVAAVNERILLSQTTTSLQLGTGGVLARYDYVSTNMGSKHQHGFTNTDNYIYFFDIGNKTIFQLGDSLNPISTSKFVSSQLKRNLNGYVKITDNPVHYNINTGGYRSGVLVTYDYYTKEVFFTFIDAIQDNLTATGWREDKFTLVYSDENDYFTEFITQYPSCYINTKNKLISPNTNVKRAKFFDNSYTNSPYVGKVSFLFNQPHPFQVGDYVQILQDTGALNLQYNTYATILAVPNSTTVVTDLVFGVSTPPNPGLMILPINKDLYIHDIGEYGEFYGTKYDSSITFVSNKFPTETKIFTNMELITETTKSTLIEELPFAIDVPSSTFTTSRFYNDYQNTDFIPLSTISRKIERKLNIAIPGNRVLYKTITPGIIDYNIFDQSNLSSTRKAYTERMRGNHLFVDLLYNNSSNYKIVLHSAKTLFEKSYN